MWNQLQAYYGQHFVTSSDTPEHFDWFVTENQERFGIKKSVLSEKEHALLKALFKECGDETLSSVQQQWKQLLGGEPLTFDTPPSYRFLYFFLKGAVKDQHALMEAISSFFSEQAIILLLSPTEGIIIESMYEQDVPYEEIKTTLTADFYVELDLFIGKWQQELATSKRIYEQERALFFQARPHLVAQNVYFQEDLLPALLLSQVEPVIDSFLTELIPQDLSNDRELMHSIHVYLESNRNISAAAKTLYIHRNSLQYRVDKFIDKSGLDVKQFKQAVAVYFALLRQMR
ncbi:PucR family transcriptional regulator [Fictibacillus macauensis ZFHKF-1]|uniref:PucR family transcriptional regulator n=1 Tax=Fictibacillus macauensis ZFHKF-1 TaxID=1196324 RepID=I8AJZ9_9BACL|nr:helix-turn-helix domain-containing protein [Fictibacillus macauensis]EIT85874.1 PucR family transcriptional regulator [Fictibacillus macauensis ZFHKF-1]